MGARPVIVTPPLPAQIAGRAWLCIAHRNGTRIPADQCNFFYFAAQTNPLPNPVLAAITATDWFNRMALPVITTFGFNVRWDPILVWLWDGSVLHTFTYQRTIDGTLPFISWHPSKAVCVLKRGIFAGEYVLGRSWFGPINSSWAHDDTALSALGLTHFQGMASVVFSNFTSQGNIWVPSLFLFRSGGALVPISELTVRTPTTYLRKRRISSRPRPTGGFLPPAPTPAG